MKTILITISKDIIRRNILDTDFWPVLLRDNNKRIVLVVDMGQIDYYQKNFAGPNVVIEGYKAQTVIGFRKWLFSLARFGICSRSVTFRRWHEYKRGRAGLLATLLKGAVSNTLGRSAWYKKLIRAWLLKTETPTSILELFNKHKPDWVFTPSLLDLDFDVQFAIEARKRRIPVTGMVRSWDNLNHHILLAFVPDRFIFQNKWLKFAAKRFQAIDTDKIQTDILGLPHYDFYKNPGRFVKDRLEFFEGVGLDPNKKLIFLGGSEYYYSEDTLVRWLNEMIESGKIKQPAQVLFRVHPSSCFKIEDFHLNELPHIVLDNAFTDKSKPKFNDTDKFINSLFYSDVTINIGSTLSIDAAAFDKPAIAIDFDDPAKKLSYWESVKRFNDYFDHQIHLIATGGVRVPKTPEELTRDINSYLDDPSLDKGGRRKVIDEFAEPFDGKAGERLAKILGEGI